MIGWNGRSDQPHGDDNGDEGGASVLRPKGVAGWLACLRGNYKHVLTEHYDHTRTRATHTDRGEGGREEEEREEKREEGDAPVDSFLAPLKNARKNARRTMFFEVCGIPCRPCFTVF